MNVPASRKAWSLLDDYAGLDDPRPVTASRNVVHGPLRHTVRCGDHPLRDVVSEKHADTLRLGVSELRLPLTFPNWGPIPALGLTVPHVIGIRSEGKMRRFDTKRIVAGVQNAHSLRNRTAVCPRPRESMGENGSPSRQPHSPVSAVPSFVPGPSRPFQTRAVAPRSTVESFPETLWERRDRDMISRSHCEPPAKVPAVRSGEALTRLPGRFYFTRGEA